MPSIKLLNATENVIEIIILNIDNVNGNNLDNNIYNISEYDESYYKQL